MSEPLDDITKAAIKRKIREGKSKDYLMRVFGLSSDQFEELAQAVVRDAMGLMRFTKELSMSREDLP